MPSVTEFDYSFDHLAEIIEQFVEKLGLNQYFLYVMDYGAPIGFRLASAHPERVLGLIVQNGNAYEEGLREFWQPIRAYWQDKSPQNAQFLADNLLTLEATRWQYTNGVRHPEAIAPDNWFHDQYLLDRPGNKEIQLELFSSYQTNLPLYPQWQQYFRQYQPPTLLMWGQGDYIFPSEGAYPYQRDLKNIEFHLLDTGHFALEEDLDFISAHIRSFVLKNMTRPLNLTGEGVAIQGYDPVSYFSGQPTLGNSDISSTYDGATYYFITPENKEKFDQEPTQYMPQYGGFCAVAVSEGKLVSVDPLTYKITDEQLYLFYNGEHGNTKPYWDADEATYKVNADERWASGDFTLA